MEVKLERRNWYPRVIPPFQESSIYIITHNNIRTTNAQILAGNWCALNMTYSHASAANTHDCLWLHHQMLYLSLLFCQEDPRFILRTELVFPSPPLPPFRIIFFVESPVQTLQEQNKSQILGNYYRNGLNDTTFLPLIEIKQRKVRLVFFHHNFDVYIYLQP